MKTKVQNKGLWITIGILALLLLGTFSLLVWFARDNVAMYAWGVENQNKVDELNKTITQQKSELSRMYEANDALNSQAQKATSDYAMCLDDAEVMLNETKAACLQILEDTVAKNKEACETALKQIGQSNDGDVLNNIIRQSFSYYK